MENDEKMMTGEESLKIITEMLNRTRVNFRQGSFHLLFWGWLIIICSLWAIPTSRFTDALPSLVCMVPGNPGCFCFNGLRVC